MSGTFKITKPSIAGTSKLQKGLFCSRQNSNLQPSGYEPSILPQNQRGLDDNVSKHSFYKVLWREIQIRNKELTKGCILMGTFFLKVFKLKVKNSNKIVFS